MEFTIAHASVAISAATLLTVIKSFIRIGRFMEQFEHMKRRVKIHDVVLGLDIALQEPTVENTE